MAQQRRRRHVVQVQAQVDLKLRARELGRTTFVGQHIGGGLLDMIDAALKTPIPSTSLPGELPCPLPG